MTWYDADGLGPVEFACRALTGPERLVGSRYPRLAHYGTVWLCSAFLAIYLTAGCLWLFGPWPLQPQDRPIAWVYYFGCTAALAWLIHLHDTRDRLVVHERGFRYRIGLFYRGRITYENLRELEVGRGLDFDRLGALRFVTKRHIIQAGRNVSACSAIVKTHDGKLKVMIGVLSRFTADDLGRWLETVAVNCPGRVRMRTS